LIRGIMRFVVSVITLWVVAIDALASHHVGREVINVALHPKLDKADAYFCLTFVGRRRKFLALRLSA